MGSRGGRQRRIPDTPVLRGGIGERIRSARLRRGMSRTELAGDDFSLSFLSLVERDKSGLSLRSLQIMARRLGEPLSYFLQGTASDLEVTETVLDRAESHLLDGSPQLCLDEVTGRTVPDALRPRTLLVRGRALLDLGQVRDALETLQEGLTEAEQQGTPGCVPHLQYSLALALSAVGSSREAIVYLERSLEAAHQAPADPLLQARLLIELGRLRVVQGEGNLGLEQWQRGIEIAAPLNDRRTLGQLYARLSGEYEALGDAAQAQRYAALGLALFDADRSARYLARQLAALAREYNAQKRWDEALGLATKALSQALELGSHEAEAVARGVLAGISLRAGNVEAAQAEAEMVLALALEEVDEARLDAEIVLAQIAEQRGDLTEADRLYQHVIAVLRATGRKKRHAEVCISYSFVLERRGDATGALRLARQAIDPTGTSP